MEATVNSEICEEYSRSFSRISGYLDSYWLWEASTCAFLCTTLLRQR